MFEFKFHSGLFFVKVSYKVDWFRFRFLPYLNNVVYKVTVESWNISKVTVYIRFFKFFQENAYIWRCTYRALSTTFDLEIVNAIKYKVVQRVYEIQKLDTSPGGYWLAVWLLSIFFHSLCTLVSNNSMVSNNPISTPN